MLKRSYLVSVAGMLSIAATALADSNDVGLRLLNNQIRTVNSIGEPPNQNIEFGESRVFGVELAFNPLTSFVQIDEPGYASDDPGLLGSPVTFNIRKALRAWVGSTFAPTSQVMSTGSDDLALPFINTPATDTTVIGYTFNVLQDFHFDWKLNGATTSTGGGIYLVELELTSSIFQTSRPYWLVFNYDQPEPDHDAAIDWVQQNLVPTPGAAGVLGMGLLLGLRRKR
jgi:hypothetical protein